MHYIKDIFEGVNSEHAHNKLIRYSRGKFIGPLIKIRISKTEIKLSTSFHFVDELYQIIASVIGSNKVEVKGTIVWNKDLTPEFSEVGLKYLKVSKSRGIYKYSVENEVEFSKFIEVLGDFNLLISFKTDDGISLVTKPSFPKPNKEINNTFCKVSLPISFKDTILSEFVFDSKSIKTIKSVSIAHDLIIDDIILPDVDNFEIARKEAKRVGKVIRYLEVNSEPEIISEKEFKV